MMTRVYSFPDGKELLGDYNTNYMDEAATNYDDEYLAADYIYRLVEEFGGQEVTLDSKAEYIAAALQAAFVELLHEAVQHEDLHDALPDRIKQVIYDSCRWRFGNEQ